jgi:hypothetical protein
MSFIAGSKGQGYEPGYFLAHEECTRETREISQDGATVAENGGKYVPMGTAYPSNDSNAIGIIYEDVDVTNGNMPGSVVTKGEVYENLLAVTGKTYGEATVTAADNPATKGWYEKDGETYSLSTDTVASRDKKYYTSDGETEPTYTHVETIVYGDNPKELELYEKDGNVYSLSTDTQADGSKTYYKVTGVTRLSEDAKTALIAVGFKFVSEPTITRPDFKN